MDQIARFIMLNAVDRPVLDQTGLTGHFSVELEFSRDALAGAGTSIFTAVREQLGLKLESTRTPLEVVVIERVERPAPD